MEKTEKEIESKSLKPTRNDIQRVNVDFTHEMLAELDAEARRLHVSRQAVIKTMIAETLSRKQSLKSIPKV